MTSKSIFDKYVLCNLYIFTESTCQSFRPMAVTKSLAGLDIFPSPWYDTTNEKSNEGEKDRFFRVREPAVGASRGRSSCGLLALELSA